MQFPNNIMKFIKSIKLMYKNRKYIVITIISALIMFALAFLIPVVITPGNTLGYQASLLSLSSFILFVSFSIIFGISMAMNIYAISLNKNKKLISMGKGTGNTFFGVAGTMFSGPLCASCISTIVGLFGLSGATAISLTSFLFSHRTGIIAISLGIILLSMYFTGRRINNVCEKC